MKESRIMTANHLTPLGVFLGLAVISMVVGPCTCQYNVYRQDPFALLSATNAQPRLFVYRTSADLATHRVQVPLSDPAQPAARA